MYLLQAKLDFRSKVFHLHRVVKIVCSEKQWLYQKPTKSQEYTCIYRYYQDFMPVNVVTRIIFYTFS